MQNIRHCEVRSNPRHAKRTYMVATNTVWDCFVPRNDGNLGDTAVQLTIAFALLYRRIGLQGFFNCSLLLPYYLYFCSAV
jgi:hypothetical protein